MWIIFATTPLTEYARVAETGSGGVLSAVPVIFGMRTLAKYRYGAGDGRIEGLEIARRYSASKPDSDPVLTLKFKIMLSRDAHGDAGGQ